MRVVHKLHEHLLLFIMHCQEVQQHTPRDVLQFNMRDHIMIVMREVLSHNVREYIIVLMRELLKEKTRELFREVSEKKTREVSEKKTRAITYALLHAHIHIHNPFPRW